MKPPVKMTEPRFRILEHTADIGIAMHGTSLAELFTAAAAGMLHLICPDSPVLASRSHQLQIRGEGLEELLVNWLSEINYLCQAHRFLTAQIEIHEIGPRQLQATVLGEAIDPLRHGLQREIKAVTWHRIEVRQLADEWQAEVYFDI